MRAAADQFERLPSIAVRSPIAHAISKEIRVTNMKDEHVIALIAILIAVDQFVEHPTYGRGWRAVIALMRVAFAA